MPDTLCLLKYCLTNNFARSVIAQPVTKYCSSCSSTRKIEGGEVISFRSSDRAFRTRWRCRHCATKSSESVYSKKPHGR